MIRVTIEAPRGEGKTLCARTIQLALTALGAVVTVREMDGTPTARAMDQYASRLMLAAREGQQLLAGKSVEINTFNPPGTQG